MGILIGSGYVYSALPLSDRASHAFIAEHDVLIEREPGDNYDVTWQEVVWQDRAQFEKLKNRRIVAVFDTGIAQRKQFNILGEKNFVDEQRVLAEDTNGHGTCVASVIAAKASDNYRSYSPGTGLYIAKVTDNDSEVDTHRFNSALRWALDNNVAIVSITVPIGNTDSESEMLFREATQKKTLILVSAGEGDWHKMESVVSVGSSVETGPLLPVVVLNQRQTQRDVDVYTPGSALGMTHQSKELRTLVGVDASVATVAGILARTTVTNAHGATKSLEKLIEQPFFK